MLGLRVSVGFCLTNISKHELLHMGGFLSPVKLEIQAPPGTPVGYVVQNWHPCLPKFTIQDERRMDVLKISGPCVVCSCCKDVNFEVCNAKIVCVYLLSDNLTIVCCFTYYQSAVCIK